MGREASWPVIKTHPEDFNMHKTNLYCLAMLLMAISASSLGAEPSPPAAPEQHYLLTLAIMVIAGAGGGMVNYYYRQQSSAVDNKDWFSCVVIGVGASLLVPFLLSLMSSTLVDNAVSGKGYLTLLSWCLLAGISGEPFITQMVERFKSPNKP
jgi:hypothetical protein